jgi:5,10-methylenetetrahydromethanopterin reductase
MEAAGVGLGAIVLGEADIGAMRDRAVLAEELGYDFVGVGDVPMHYRELYVSLAVVAGATRRVRIGPMVTNPVTRHPGVTAAAAATLDAAAGGRVVLGMGAGGGPLFSLGLEVPTLASIGGAVTTIRRLLAGSPSVWEGKPLTQPPAARTVPVFLAAYGLRTARLAGEVADGVIFAGGVSAAALGAGLTAVAEGAAAAGRDPSDVEVWVMARAAVADTTDEAVAGIKANLASAGSHGLRSAAQLATVPDDVRGRIVELQRRYTQSEHVRWDGANARLIDELGLTGFLAERFAIAGTPDEVRDRVRELARFGVTRLIVPAVDREPDRFLRDFAAAVAL